MVIDGDRQDLFRLILADHILIQPGFDLRGRQDADAFQRVGVITRLSGIACRTPGCARAGRLRPVGILVKRMIAHINAVFTDVDAGADQKLFHLILGAPAKAADQLASFSVLAGRCVCHVVPPNQCL